MMSNSEATRKQLGSNLYKKGVKCLQSSVKSSCYFLLFCKHFHPVSYKHRNSIVTAV
jgi:hypothetical protein